MIRASNSRWEKHKNIGRVRRSLNATLQALKSHDFVALRLRLTRPTADHLFGLKLIALITLAWVLLGGGSLAYAAPPSAIEVQYDVIRSGVKVAEVNEKFSREKYHYMITSNTKPHGFFSAFVKGKDLKVTSVGLMSLQGLKPQVFDYQRGNDRSKDAGADINWTTKKITLRHEGKTTALPLPDGTQDRISVMYQFMFLPIDRSTESISFAMTNGKKLDNYRYGVVPNQRIKLQGKEMKTTYLYHQSEVGETKTEIWLCEQFSNLPCKMVVTDEDGDELTQELSKIRIKP